MKRKRMPKEEPLTGYIAELVAIRRLLTLQLLVSGVSVQEIARSVQPDLGAAEIEAIWKKLKKRG